MTTRPSRKSPSSLLSATKASSARTRSSPRLKARVTTGAEDVAAYPTAEPTGIAKPTTILGSGVIASVGAPAGDPEVGATDATVGTAASLYGSDSPTITANDAPSVLVHPISSSLGNTPPVADSIPGVAADGNTDDAAPPSAMSDLVPTGDVAGPTSFDYGEDESAVGTKADSPSINLYVTGPTAATANTGSFSKDTRDATGDYEEAFETNLATDTGPAILGTPTEPTFTGTGVTEDLTDTSPSPKNLYSIFSPKTPSKAPTLTTLGKP